MKRGNIFAVEDLNRRSRLDLLEEGSRSRTYLRAIANFEFDAMFRAFMAAASTRLEISGGRSVIGHFIDALVRNGIVERISIPTFYLRSEPLAPVRGPYPLAHGEEATVGDRKLDAWIRSCLQHDECRESPEMGAACPWAEPAPLIDTTGVEVHRVGPDGTAQVNRFTLPIGPIMISPFEVVRAPEGSSAEALAGIEIRPEAWMPPDRVALVGADGAVEVARITPPTDGEG